MKRAVLPLVTAGTTLAVCRLGRSAGSFDVPSRLSRRALIKIGGLGVAAAATGAWRSGLGTGSSADSEVLAASCILTPEQTEGPYYISGEKVRSNITEHRAGTPLNLRFTVVDASTCRPIKDAAVDIWHCDAGGVYSGFEAASAGGPPGGGAGPTDKHTFLRGIQLTNAKGRAEFETIYPGWYRGRTVHIHVKVHLGGHTVGDVVHTGQLYFSDALTARVYRSEPYKARAAQRDTLNATDGIFQNGGRQSMLTMRRAGRGYAGSIVLGVRRD